MALRFLQVEEKIKIVNIDSSDIVDQKLKLILGLVWMLILHYSISMPTWDDDEEPTVEKKEQTPKQRLLAWIQNKAPDQKIGNFTSDWNDGKAIGALVDGVAPGLCPDWEDWDAKNALSNTTEAMNSAEQWLDIPQLIRPEEMCNSKVDELSMMTYLSQFPNAQLKPGAPLRPRTNPSRVRAYGPGLYASGNSVGAPARFTVETFSAGKGELDLKIINPNGVQEPHESVFNNDQYLTYSCSYKPTMEGTYKVHIQFVHREISKSPFVVQVEGIAGDPTKVTASGPGLEKKGNVVKKKTGFDVFTKNAGFGVVDVVVIDPHGDKNSVRPKVTQASDDQWRVEYIPSVEGPHSVNIFFAGTPIPVSPIAINVSPAIDSNKCIASGRGIQATGLRVGDKAPFRIQTKTAGAGGHLDVKVVGPGGTEEDVSVDKQADDATYDCCYMPQRPGQYVVDVTYGGHPIPKSPFKVRVRPTRQCLVRAYGPGLVGGMVGYPSRFTVETNGETGMLGFSIEGPSKSKIECKDNEDGSAETSYFPVAPGEYAVHILVDDEDISGSPFMADIRPAASDFDPSKVEVYGKGLQPLGLTSGEPAEFIIDTRKAGNAQTVVAMLDVDQNPIDVSIRESADGRCTCQYVPVRSVRHTAVISFGGLAVPGSPFRMMIKERSDASKVKIFGPAFTNKVLTFDPTYFVIDCIEAGPGDIRVEVHDGKHQNVAVKTNGEGKTYTVAFEPSEVGEYTAHVYFADKEVPGCPKKFSVVPSVDLSHVRVLGLERKVFVESPIELFVDLQSVAAAISEKLKVVITAPSGDRMEANVGENQDGRHRCSFSLTEEGTHNIDIRYGGLPVPSSPFQVEAVEGCDPSKVLAFGPGLTGGWTFKPQHFTVDTKNAGKGGLGLAIEGPSEAKTTCRDNRDGTCNIEYLPVKSGIYDVAVKFSEQHIPGSPFQVCIKDEFNPDRVRCFGSALDLKQVRLGQVVLFMVDASEAGEATLDVVITDRNGVSHQPAITSQGNGLYEVTYEPKVEGQHKVSVSYGNQPVPDSPFLLNVLPKFEASRVALLGEGIRGPVLASLPTSFVADTTDAGDALFQVIIKDQDNKEVHHQMASTKDGRQTTVTYTASAVGKIQVDVRYGGEPVASSPFSLDVSAAGDINAVKIVDGVRSFVPVGDECSIIIDRSAAGVGNIACDIDGDVKSTVTDRDDGTVEVTYVLPRKGVFNVQLKFGGQPISGGRFDQEALDIEDYRNLLKDQEEKLTSSLSSGLINGVYANGIDGLDTGGGVLLYNPVDFTIAVGPVFGFVKAEVTTPSGKHDWPKVIDNRNGTVTIRYQPMEIGLHQLDVKYNDFPVNGSPFQFSVDAVRAGKVTAHGGGLMQGIAGNKCSFVIDTVNNNSSGLVVLIEGPSKTDIHVEDNNDNTCTVSYTPMLPGDYQVYIRFADQDIAGSPYTAKILPPSADDTQVVHLSVGSSSKSEISLMIVESDVENLTATMRSPSGREAPCVLKQLMNGQLGISFCPKEKGTHFVSVLRSGQHVDKSPFRINILENQLCRVDKVRAFGKGLTEGQTNEFSEFLVNCKDAGFGNLSLSIEGPGKVQINCREEEVGICLVRYKAFEPGTYIINVRFADDDIGGSPFLVPIKGQSSDLKSEKITDALDISEITHIGCECRLRLTIKGVELKDLEANVVNPSFLTEACHVGELEQGLYSVVFVPQEVGVHTVRVRHCGIDIPGSPFKFTVGPVLEGGADQVQVTGNGLNGGKTDSSGHFNISTRKAGAGNLSVVMEGPSKAVIGIQDRLDGSCDASYVCSQPGEYWLSVKFNGEHVLNSPFRIPVAPSGDEISLAVTDDEVCQVNKPTSLLLNMIGSGGPLEAMIIDPSGSEDQAFVQQLNNGRVAVRFIPHSNGLHHIHVKRNGYPVYGSPFQVYVGKQEPNPALVHAHGEGLRKGWTGRPAKFFVKTAGAGPGALTVNIDGPSKVEVVCRELDNGFELSYVPRAPGLYKISLTYGGETHIPNSPFMAHVEGQGRPSAWNEQSQVIVESTANNKRTSSEHLTISPQEAASLIASEGPGLHKGLVDRESMFTVDTSRAGQGILLVGVMGPSGPCEEVNIKHLGSGHYAVSYQPKERGNYMVVIRWGDQHIPGSPFEVLVQ